jgi:hypothetical protein
LNGVTFLRELLRNGEQNHNLSLNQMGINVLDKDGKPVSKQAIDGRFNDRSLAFIKKIFENYLLKTNVLLQSDQDMGWMDLFGRVLVKDGTRFDLPACMASHFKGFGGSCTSQSGICIQLEYDLKTGNIAEFKTTSANVPDSKDAQQTKDNIEKSDLILRDLGYFGLNVFEEMIRKKSSFISKLNTQVSIFEQKDEQFKALDFKAISKRFEKTNCQQMELEVFMGMSTKIPVRLVIEKVPEQIYKQRMEQAIKNAKKKGCKVSAEYSIRQQFSCYITNIPKQTLKAEAIREIYRLRWQVELVFKIWKSTYNIEKTRSMKYTRWMTLFYARMLLMLIHWQIYHVCRKARQRLENKLLSITKCMQTLRLSSPKITGLINQAKTKIASFVWEIRQILSSNHDLEKKKGRKNQEEIINIIYCLPIDYV